MHLRSNAKHDFPRTKLADLSSGLKHGLQFWLVQSVDRRVNGDEYELSLRERLTVVAGKVQAPRLQVAPNQTPQSGLVDCGIAITQRSHTRNIVTDCRNFVAHLGKTSRENRSLMPKTHDTNPRSPNNVLSRVSSAHDRLLGSPPSTAVEKN